MGQVRIIPVMSKILLVFIAIIFVSNLSSNYINLIFNRSELIRQMRQLLAKDLEDMHNFCNNQYEIYELTRNKKASVLRIVNRGQFELKNKKSIVLGVNPDGSFLFQASRIEPAAKFEDEQILNLMKENLTKKVQQSFLQLSFNGDTYFAAYRYNSKWETFIVLGEEEEEFYSRQRDIFWNISGIILFITIASALVGIFLFSQILRYVRIISSSIMRMLETQQLKSIDLKKAPNDDITFLGTALNSLVNTVDTMMSIFRKFTNQDIVLKAYRERKIRLEGSQYELSILFTDIKSFTFITEVLGSDIINLLNLHYDRAIRQIIRYNGIVGSIIGDALLAVFGVPEIESEECEYVNKSHQALIASYKLHEVTALLHEEMKKKHDEIVKNSGKLTFAESQVYQAALLEIGVGIDGGNVFYGTLGSDVRMTSTVIGDNVNSASRLEGLTRVYKVPIVCSEYVKQDIEANVANSGIRFVELDRVQVKGKTIWRRVYWPIKEDDINLKGKKELEHFSAALNYYYKGKWELAHNYFSRSKLAPAQEFMNRTSSMQPPDKWDGVWEMQSK